MRLSVGAIGSLLACQLSRHSKLPVRLIVQNRDYYHALSQKEICIERDGLRDYYRGFQAELLPKPRHFYETSANEQITESRIERERRKDERLQSLGPISSLFVTTKAQSVLPALAQLQPRLSSNSTIVLMQNGAGLVDQLLSKLFIEEAQRPSFIIAINSHGAFVKDWGKKGAGLHTVWAGVGDIAFGVLPNQAARQAITSLSPATQSNPLLHDLGALTPDMSSLPLSANTQSLYNTVSSLLACEPLNPTWHSMSKLSKIQMQKVVVNCVINPLTAIYNVPNGFLSRNNSIHETAYRICREACAVFAQHTLRTADHEMEHSEEEQRELQYIEEHGSFPPGHALNTDVLHDRAMQVAKITAHNISSTLADVRAGKQETEL